MSINHDFNIISPSFPSQEFMIIIVMYFRVIGDMNIHDSALRRLVEMQQERKGDVSNVLIGGKLLYKPWSHSFGVQWNSGSKDQVTTLYNTSTSNTANMTPPRTFTGNLADVTLYPAPGEHLTLHITVLDDVLTEKVAGLVMEVRFSVRRFAIGSYSARHMLYTLQNTTRHASIHMPSKHYSCQIIKTFLYTKSFLSATSSGERIQRNMTIDTCIELR